MQENNDEISRVESLLGIVSPRYPNAPAITEWTGTHWEEICYGDLSKKAILFSEQLKQHGIRPGQRVILMSRNRIEAVIALLGIWLAEATVALIDPDLPDSVLIDQCATADARFAIVEESEVNKITAEHLIVMHESEFFWEEKTVALSRTTDQDCDPNLAALVFTSGTTGRYRAVMLTHHNFIYSMQSYQRVSPELKCGISVMPLFHSAGLLCGILQPIFLNGNAIIFRSFRIEALQQAFLRYKPFMLITVPRLLEVMDKKIQATIADRGVAAKIISTFLLQTAYFFNRFLHINLGKLFFGPLYKKLGGNLEIILCGSAPLMPQAQKHFLAMGFKLLCGYGLTETCGPITLSTISDRWKIGNVGPCTNDNDLLISNSGEILYRGKSLMAGYFRDENSTSTVNQDGFFHTGDLGRKDKANNVFISGRIKELIVFSDGKKAFPEQIEKQYADIPNMEEYAVFPIEKNEIKIAALAFAPTENSDIQQTIQQLLSKASQLKSPYRITDVIPVDKLPRSNTLKIKRHELSKIYLKNKAREKNNMKENAPVQYKKHLQAMLACFQSVLHDKETGITPDITFAELGIDSLLAAQLCMELNEKLNLSLHPTVFWFSRTIQELHDAVYMEKKDAKKNPTLKTVLFDNRIAIVALDCVFPGAPDFDIYWKNLIAGKDAIIEIPISRWNIDDYYDPYPLEPGKTNSRHGGFIGLCDDFPSEEFDIKPRIAKSMDPEQKILLMQTRRLLGKRNCRDTKTGLFIGAGFSDFMVSNFKTPIETVNPYTGIGMADFSMVGRVAYHFGLVGPALLIKTACSSSLVAVHQAIRALQCGDCDSAIAGGINIMLTPEINVCLTKGGFLSSNGRCKSFDAAANGYVRSEGCGLVFLKRYEDAVRDGDPILSVIMGSAINQDGASNGLTAPSGKAQTSCYQEALENAQLSAHEINFVEAHGSGTQLGDAIEMQSIQQIYDQKRASDNPLYVGAVKSTIGHCEAAAGIAGLIKLVGVLNQQIIPPNLHYHTPNPNISFENSSVILPQKPTVFHGQYGAVSSFGIAGTNVHMVVARHGPYSPLISSTGIGAIRATPSATLPNRK